MSARRVFLACACACLGLVATACPVPPPANVAPVAVATATPDSGDAPLIVTFDGSGSTDSNGTIASYAWDFDDGDTGTGVSPVHQYDDAGVYTVTLTVTDNQNATNATTVTVTVTEAPPAPGRYVATTGTDAGDCALPTTACATIAYAVGQAIDSETVFVAAGAYPEMVTVAKHLTFKGANAGVAGSATRGAESVVQGFRNPGNPGTVQYDVTIDGFRIDPQGDALLISATAAPLVWLYGGATGTSVVNNVFHGGDFVPTCAHNCTTMADFAYNVRSGVATFSDNFVENFRRPINIQQPLGAPATDATVSDNVITGVTSRAISVAGSTGVALQGQTVTGNVVTGGGWTAPSGPAGVTISNGGNDVSGNTFQGLASGVYIDLCKKFVMTNNSITGNDFLGNNGGVNINVNSDGGQCVNSVTEGSGGWVAGGGRIDGLVVSGNDFVGNVNYAIRHAAYNWAAYTAVPAISAGPLDVSCNWFNSASGPTVATVLFGNPLVPVPDQVVNSAAPHAQLEPTPWLTAQGGACDGGI